ncbi:hypothetical protein [Sphingobacterium yanglingense]|uniref:Uncharacterized protein n=1 Tax=Sphingobacterium yanglingense TaxID=1437280 RepID=A0A4R6WF75_9SPHI|nr:hypothetical protein [Sphingobacterium yanglingense]TDQ73930.1 hypothetical protein CLV99_4368 [Sphingobacterium yanglingense]
MIDAFFFYLIIFAPIIALLGLIIFGIYWLLNKKGYRIAALIASSVLMLVALSGAIFFVFEDSFFSKSDAVELLSRHNIVLKDDFEILSNTTGGFNDYGHSLKLSISNNDKRSFINQKTWTRYTGTIPMNLPELAEDRYEGDTLKVNYMMEDRYIYTVYQPNGKGVTPTLVTISVSKHDNVLIYEEVLD